ECCASSRAGLKLMWKVLGNVAIEDGAISCAVVDVRDVTDRPSFTRFSPECRRQCAQDHGKSRGASSSRTAFCGFLPNLTGLCFSSLRIGRLRLSGRLICALTGLRLQLIDRLLKSRWKLNLRGFVAVADGEVRQTRGSAD